MKAAPEYEMTKEDWIAMHDLMKLMRVVCTVGVVEMRRQMHAALPESPSTGKTR